MPLTAVATVIVVAVAVAAELGVVDLVVDVEVDEEAVVAAVGHVVAPEEPAEAKTPPPLLWLPLRPKRRAQSVLSAVVEAVHLVGSLFKSILTASDCHMAVALFA